MKERGVRRISVGMAPHYETRRGSVRQGARRQTLGAPANGATEMTSGQMALIEKKQKFYGKTNLSPLWGVRKVIINPVYEEDVVVRFPNNRIVSSRYTKWNFIPKNLFEQFHRLCNLWFLLISVAQLIYTKSENFAMRYATGAPLICLLGITMIKDACEDIRRHRSDKEQDSRITHLVDPSEPHAVLDIYWREVRVGDVLQLFENEEIPADLVLLSSPNRDGAAYLDTISLDGENDLKLKSSVRETRNNITAKAVGSVRGQVMCEQPTPSLDTFHGSLKLHAHPRATPLNAENYLVRGSKLRNTAHIFGLVVCTGRDTRLSRNTLRPRARLSVIDADVNKYIFLVFLVLISCAVISVVANFAIFYSSRTNNVLWYFTLVTGKVTNADSSLFDVVLSFILLYNNLIPISLMVTIDIVRWIQTRIMENDARLVQRADKCKSQARSANVCETLGMVDIIFCDKTGTITRNDMRFQACAVAGKVYGVRHRLRESPLQEETATIASLRSGHQSSEGFSVPALPSSRADAGFDLLLQLSRSSAGEGTDDDFSVSLPSTSDASACAESAFLNDQESHAPYDFSMGSQRSDSDNDSPRSEVWTPEHPSLDAADEEEYQRRLAWLSDQTRGVARVESLPPHEGEDAPSGRMFPTVDRGMPSGLEIDSRNFSEHALHGAGLPLESRYSGISRDSLKAMDFNTLFAGRERDTDHLSTFNDVTFLPETKRSDSAESTDRRPMDSLSLSGSSVLLNDQKSAGEAAEEKNSSSLVLSQNGNNFWNSSGTSSAVPEDAIAAEEISYSLSPPRAPSNISNGSPLDSPSGLHNSPSHNSQSSPSDTPSASLHDSPRLKLSSKSKMLRAADSVIPSPSAFSIERFSDSLRKKSDLDNVGLLQDLHDPNCWRRHLIHEFLKALAVCNNVTPFIMLEPGELGSWSRGVPLDFNKQPRSTKTTLERQFTFQRNIVEGDTSGSSRTPLMKRLSRSRRSSLLERCFRLPAKRNPKMLRSYTESQSKSKKKAMNEQPCSLSTHVATSTQNRTSTTSVASSNHVRGGPPNHRNKSINHNHFASPSPEEEIVLLGKGFGPSSLNDTDNRTNATGNISGSSTLITFHKRAKWTPELRSKLFYQSYSPDEECLVSAAALNGYALVEKTAEQATLDIGGKVIRYEILGMSPWNEQRRRTSICIREIGKNKGGAMFYCMGGDDIMLPLLNGSDKLKAQISRHVYRFGCRGLRTLIFGFKRLSSEQADQYRSLHAEARTSVYNRKERNEHAALQYECDLTYLGVTATKDRLQYKVPKVIDTLYECGTRLWLLTGDNPDYTLRVAMRARIIQRNALIFRADFRFPSVATTLRADTARKQGHRIFERYKSIRLSTTLSAGGICFLTTGKSLAVYLAHRELQNLLLFMTGASDAVICARVTPVHKAQFLQLLRRRLTPSPVILGVGDGANDISMLQAAHCGVAINRGNTQEAVTASDFALPSFAKLVPLLFIYGRLNYMRMSRLINWFLFKSFLLVFPIFYFSHSTAWSGTSLYDPALYMTYNLVFTSLPIIVAGIADWDVPENLCPHVPVLYILGRRRTYLNSLTVLLTFVESCVWSLIIYFVTRYVITAKTPLSSVSTAISSLRLFGAVMNTLITIAANVKQILIVQSYSRLWIFLMAATFILYGPIISLADVILDTDTAACLTEMFKSPLFWMEGILTMAVLYAVHILFTHIESFTLSNLPSDLRAVAWHALAAELSRQQATLSSIPTKMDSAFSTVPRAITSVLRLIFSPANCRDDIPRPKNFQLNDTALAYASFLTNERMRPNDGMHPSNGIRKNQFKQHRVGESSAETVCRTGPSPANSALFNRSETSLGSGSGSGSDSGTKQSKLLRNAGCPDPEIISLGSSNNSAELLCSRFKNEDDFRQSANVPAAPAPLEGNKPSVWKMLSRRTLHFRDKQLESEYQSIRRKLALRERRRFLFLFTALLVTSIVYFAGELYMLVKCDHPPVWISDISYIGLTAGFLIFGAIKFKQLYVYQMEIAASAYLCGVLFLLCVSPLEGGLRMGTYCVFCILGSILMRIQFTLALFLNGIALIAFCVAVLMSSPVPLLMLCLPHAIGIIAVVGYAGYRLEGNQRRRFLLHYQVELARRKQREILNTMLPAFIVDKMLAGGRSLSLPAEDRGTVTVVFCDVYEFQKIVNAVEPTRLVELLDSLFLCFDRCCEEFNCTKVETVFETYLCATGLRRALGKSEDPQKDALDSVDIALTMLEVASYISYEVTEHVSESFGSALTLEGKSKSSADIHNLPRSTQERAEENTLHESPPHAKSHMSNDYTSSQDSAYSRKQTSKTPTFSGRQLTTLEASQTAHKTLRIRCKVGIHSGRVISGVVGTKKPQYALFGDTVNTASRMKLTGEPDYVHISSATNYKRFSYVVPLSHRPGLKTEPPDMSYNIIRGSFLRSIIRYDLVKHDLSLRWTPRTVDVKGKGKMRTYLLEKVAASLYPSFTTKVDNSMGSSEGLDLAARVVESGRYWAEFRRQTLQPISGATVLPARETSITGSLSDEITRQKEAWDKQINAVPEVRHTNDQPEHSASVGSFSSSVTDNPTVDTKHTAMTHCGLDVKNHMEQDLDSLPKTILLVKDSGRCTATREFDRRLDRNAASPRFASETIHANALDNTQQDGQMNVTADRRDRIHEAVTAVNRAMRRISVFQPARTSIQETSFSEVLQGQLNSADRDMSRERSKQDGGKPPNSRRESSDYKAGTTAGERSNDFEKSSALQSQQFRMNPWTLSFRNAIQETQFQQFFYFSPSRLAAVEQTLLVFLVTFVFQTIIELHFIRLVITEYTQQRLEFRNSNLYWAIKAMFISLWFLIWAGFYYRMHATKIGRSRAFGTGSLTFALNVSLISSACIFLISPAWALKYENDVIEWTARNIMESTFYITVIHHNMPFLFQYVNLVNMLLAMLLWAFIGTVCELTPMSTASLVYTFAVFFFNSMSVYFREHTERSTWLISEETLITEDRANKLLSDMLPKQVLQEFQQDRLRLAYRHDRMTFLFADICGFTNYANSVDATEVVALLQELFAKFDAETTRFGLYKLCTIGDAYVTVTQPVTEDNQEWNPIEGAERVLEMAWSMIDHIRLVRDRMNIPTLNMRIGLHYGKCVGGVIGSGRLRYDIWGIDVLTANSMETYGVPGRINISAILKTFLEEQFPQFNKTVTVIDREIDSYLLGFEFEDRCSLDGSYSPRRLLANNYPTDKRQSANNNAGHNTNPNRRRQPSK